MIRDGSVSGGDIVVFDEADELGGSLDARGTPEHGYFMTGSRMFEHNYNATFDLFSFIPSLNDPSLSVKQDTDLAEKDAEWHNKARLVDKNRNIINFHELGFNELDRVALVALIARPEFSLDSKRITDCFGEHFFETNFWFEWCSLFAFEKWHSAIEFRRYLLRFIHHFSTIDTQEGIFRTRYNQYDSMAVPLVKWLRDKGVEFRLRTRVTDVGFAFNQGASTAVSIRYESAGTANEVAIQDGDFAFITNGSMTAGKVLGSMSAAPEKNSVPQSGAWKLWTAIAAGHPEFGDPAVFNSHVDESSWESFTVTVKDHLFFELMRKFSGSEPGEGGLITFKDSQWLLTLSIFKQPFSPWLRQ